MTDEQLAEMAAAGDQEAFASLYDRYKQALFNFAWRVVGEAGLAEDAAQEALIAAFRHIQCFDPAKGSFKTWMFTIAHNECRHSFRLRRWWSYSENSGSESSGAKTIAPDSGCSLDEKLDLERALKQLSAKYRVPLILSRLHGLSTRECAEVLKLSEVNVRQRVFRAIHRLQEILSAGHKLNRE
jgi:RNA polymerase sigma-70 factor (ECF subfamily)